MQHALCCSIYPAPLRQNKSHQARPARVPDTVVVAGVRLRPVGLAMVVSYVLWAPRWDIAIGAPPAPPTAPKAVPNC
eukprot:SAG11_NODE_34547_length_271_cov_0.889535_1_plen_76_part_01